jgi:hypothetical protein
MLFGCTVLLHRAAVCLPRTGSNFFLCYAYTLGNTFSKLINSKQYPENTGRNAYDNEA